MPLYQTITIDENEVRRLVLEHWHIDLGKCIKAAQNHTYIASEHSEAGADVSQLRKFIVRVTPDPDQTRVAPTELEVQFLRFLSANGLPVCAAVPQSKRPQELVLIEGQNIIVVFEHARGEAVDYVSWKWMTERPQVFGVGKWLGRLHHLTREFKAQVQGAEDIISRGARHWTELHSGVLKSVSVHPDDKKFAEDPSKFGLIHGDINATNYYWVPDLGLPDVFDWDQLQRSWFMYDVSQPIFGVLMLAGAGNPFTGGPCPEANPEQFRAWLLDGYQSEGHQVDVDHLDRMILIRIELYRLFCSQGLGEVAADSGLAKFFTFIMKWLNEKHPHSPKYE